ncbi:MAG: DUF367 family protein [Desulfurococcaceae archaeon]
MREVLKIYAIIYHEDDPRKNTALRMIKAGIAVPITRKSRIGKPIILNPFSEDYLGPWLKEIVFKNGILVVDASWKRLTKNKFKGLRGFHVKLPPLLPGNPVNYGKTCVLSSIEAVAASLYILGFRDLFEKLLGLYKWMNTFYDLNKELLEEYSKARDNWELVNTVIEYWGLENPCYNVEDN